MEFTLRIIQFLAKVLYKLVYPILAVFYPKKQNFLKPVTNPLLKLSLSEVIDLLKQRKLTSIEIVDAYIERIRLVNPKINAVADHNFRRAVQEADKVDTILKNITTESELEAVFKKKPLFGAPCTVKESCGVRGLAHVVGSMQRKSVICQENSNAVELLQAAGAIILLTSSNPEYCYSMETNTLTNGICINPYDYHRSAGGSSGGEGALNGAGASLFGIGSDIAGSIRIPALFNGVFGHKPTGGLTSVRGHFPYSSDPNFAKYLQIGPITRFARDLPLITQVIAGEKARCLKLHKDVDLKDIKIYYAYGFSGLNGFLHQAPVQAIKLCISRAVQHFQSLGLKTEHFDMSDFKDSLEIGLTSLVQLKDFPYLINTNNPNKRAETRKEFWKSLVGKSSYTRDGMIFELMRRETCFMSGHKFPEYAIKLKELKWKLMQKLSSRGVLLFPTFPVPAIHHNSSIFPLWNIDYTLIFNCLEVPATHCPMHIDDATELPIGFQVIASPNFDKLCFRVAREIEEAFGGWVAPSAIID